MSPAADRIKAAMALGITVTSAELAVVQRAHHDGPIVKLVRDDPLAAAASDHLAPVIRRHFAMGTDRRLAAAAGLHPSAPTSLIESTLTDQGVLVLITSAPARLTSEARDVLIAHGGPRERRAVARSSDEATQLRALASDNDHDVRIAVAWNVATPPDVERTLSGDAASGVRAAIARRASAPPVLLGELSNDEHETVRSSVAANRSTPATAQAVLAHDPSSHVRAALASNRNVAGAALDQLCADPDPAIRARVAANPQTDAGLLARLAHDDDADVRRQVARNPALTEPDVFTTLFGTVPNVALASNPSTPTALIDAIVLANDMLAGATRIPADAMRSEVLALARNPSCSSAAIEALFTWATTVDAERPSDQLTVARRLATNPATSPSVLELLAAHPDDQVRKRLGER